MHVPGLSCHLKTYRFCTSPKGAYAHVGQLGNEYNCKKVFVGAFVCHIAQGG